MISPGLRRMLAVSRKEWTHLRRDRRSLIAMIGMPLVLLMLYGYAMNFDIKHLAVAVYDQDHSAASRALARDISANKYFDVAGQAADPRQVTQLLDEGAIRCVLVIPPKYEATLARGKSASVQAIFDAADSNTASIALGYTEALLEASSQRLLRDSVLRRGQAASPPRIDIRMRFLYNEGLNSTLFIVPGLIAVILAMLSALLTSGTIVRERERGTIEQLLASPLRPTELMVGKLIPYTVISMFNTLLIVVAGWLLFGIWLRGSLLLLLALTLVFLPTALGFGLLASNIARTQQMALVGGFMATVLPSLLLSGFIFPLQNAPRFIQYLSNLVPATHLLVILRSIYLKGVGISVLWPQTLILAVYSVVVMSLGVRAFRERLD